MDSAAAAGALRADQSVAFGGGGTFMFILGMGACVTICILAMLAYVCVYRRYVRPRAYPPSLQISAAAYPSSTRRGPRSAAARAATAAATRRAITAPSATPDDVLWHHGIHEKLSPRLHSPRTSTRLSAAETVDPFPRVAEARIEGTSVDGGAVATVDGWGVDPFPVTGVCADADAPAAPAPGMAQTTHATPWGSGVQVGGGRGTDADQTDVKEAKADLALHGAGYPAVSGLGLPPQGLAHGLAGATSAGDASPRRSTCSQALERARRARGGLLGMGGGSAMRRDFAPVSSQPNSPSTPSSAADAKANAKASAKASAKAAALEATSPAKGVALDGGVMLRRSHEQRVPSFGRFSIRRSDSRRRADETRARHASSSSSRAQRAQGLIGDIELESSSPASAPPFLLSGSEETSEASSSRTPSTSDAGSSFGATPRLDDDYEDGDGEWQVHI